MKYPLLFYGICNLTMMTAKKFKKLEAAAIPLTSIMKSKWEGEYL